MATIPSLMAHAGQAASPYVSLPANPLDFADSITHLSFGPSPPISWYQPATASRYLCYRHYRTVTLSLKPFMLSPPIPVVSLPSVGSASNMHKLGF